MNAPNCELPTAGCKLAANKLDGAEELRTPRLHQVRTTAVQLRIRMRVLCCLRALLLLPILRALPIMS